MTNCIVGTIILILACSLQGLKASENIMYVWATHGVNVRSEPNTSSKIIGVISYGDSLTVVEKTDHKFTNLFIQSRETEKHPIYIKSNWVKITHNEKDGFIIDGYLLEFPCPDKNEGLNLYLDRMAHKFKRQQLDTKYNLRFGTVMFDQEQIVFPNDKRISWSNTSVRKQDDGIESEADYASEDIKYFKGFSKQEILIFLNIFYGLESETQSNFDSEGMYVRRNWSESIYLFGGIQEIELTLFPNQVIIFYYFSSC